jgi:hypothetical protein
MDTIEEQKRKLMISLEIESCVYQASKDKEAIELEVIKLIDKLKDLRNATK